MTSQKCCICGKQNKKDLRKVAENCEIVGKKNSSGLLCYKHEKKLNKLLTTIGNNNNSRVRVRFDKKFAKFLVVAFSSNNTMSSQNINSTKFPTSNTTTSTTTTTTSFACTKSLLATLVKQLSCTVCGKSNLSISNTTFRRDVVSSVYLECPCCYYTFKFTESEPHLQVISSSSFSCSFPSLMSSTKIQTQKDKDKDTDNVSDSSGSSRGSPSSITDANDSDEDEDESGGISPQQAASALLSLDRTPPPSQPQSPDSSLSPSESTSSFECSKKLDFSNNNSSPSLEAVPSSMPSSPASPSSTSTSSSASSSDMRSMETNMATHLTINTAVPKTPSSTSSSPTTGVKRLRSDEQDIKLQAARAQAPKKRRLDSPYTSIKPIKSQPQESTPSETRLPSFMQSFPMEPMPSFEDLAVTLKTIVPYGLNNPAQ